MSGDHGCFRRTGEILLAGVCDGLGHGPLAREASSGAFAVFHAQAATSPPELLEACHRALGPTRGAVMAISRLDEKDLSLETACVGNIAVQLAAPRATRRFGGSSAVLGSRSGTARVKSEIVVLRSEEILIMTTDGISSRLAVEEDLDLLREHPIVIAQQIVTRFGRDNDDVLVLVAK
jgi:serine/threonine protein phosphatase PrpC